MMAALMLIALAVELGLYAVLARSLGLSPAAGVALGAAAFVLVRGVLAFVLCLVTRCRSAGVALREALALVTVHAWGLLAQPWLAPRDPRRVAPGVTPVVFVHGIFCNAGVWHRQLAALRGVDNLFTVNLFPPVAGIDRFARQLAERVDEVCRAAGTSQVILVGHSMGGLVARAWLARHGGAARTARLVTLGSPHHGSRLARFAVGTCAADMRCGCAWLEKLAADERLGERVPTTSIFSLHDEFVAPQESARLEGARNVALEGLGHLELLASREVHALVAAEIAAARGASPS